MFEKVKKDAIINNKNQLYDLINFFESLNSPNMKRIDEQTFKPVVELVDCLIKENQQLKQEMKQLELEKENILYESGFDDPMDV